jgi:hypothetical protein
METPPYMSEMSDLKEIDREAVLQQTEQMLASSHFRTSRRYPAFLRYVIQETLDGHAELLKERTIGIEVFGRTPSFDTSGDSIVRVAAAEVRKRLALYYQNEGLQDKLHIDLPSGSYVAHFRWVDDPVTSSRPEVATLPATEAGLPFSRIFRWKWKRPAFLVGLIALAAVAAYFGLLYANWQRTRIDLLSPLLKSSQEIILCIGTPSLKENQPGSENLAIDALGQPTTNNTLLPLADAMAFTRFQIYLHDHGKPNRLQLARKTEFNDLRGGPVILIGALDNPWTMRLANKLRFRFVGTDAEEGEIVDSQAKPEKIWKVDFRVPYSDRSQDYAIIAITYDDTLGQPLVIAAGIGPNGTMAASEFLMNQTSLETLKKMAPKQWSGRNLEAVLSTQVIQGNSGLPQVVAAEFW